MPKLIYICTPKPIISSVYLSKSQIGEHSINTYNCIYQTPIPSYEARFINTHFIPENDISPLPNFYSALFHTFLIAESNDVVLCNMDIEYSSVNLPIVSTSLPIVFDKLIYDMCKNLMSRNITVILSASNSRIDINAFINSVNVVPSNFYFIEDTSGNCVNSQNNPAAIITSGLGGKSNFGSIVDCYFPDYNSDLRDSSAGAAWAARMVLKMQEYAFSTKGHYLKSKKIKELINSTRSINPDLVRIQGEINSLPPFMSPNLDSSPYT